MSEESRGAVVPCCLLLAGLAAAPALAQVQALAQVTDLTVVESGDDLVLDWGTGAAPYRVLRSTSPDFYFGNRVVADGLADSRAVDSGAARPGNHSWFYDVVTDGEGDPAGFASNPPPVSPPTLTGLVPDSGQPGDLVTVLGNGFQADGGRTTVTFHHAIAEIVTASETELQVLVPAGAYTGDVRVCVATDACSNPLPFYLTHGPAFQDVSSIAWETGTGSLWVADRGSADTVYEIDATGAVAARGGLGQALLGHPSPADGTGRIYYCNSVDSDFNQGTIEYVDSGSDTEVFFDSAGASGGTTSAVRCEGIAASDREPDVVYFLDGRGNTVRRIVRNALAHDLVYGDQPFTFHRPAGARFDGAGNLYLTSTTAVYRIRPGETAVDLVATGFTAAAGLDLVEMGDETHLAVADEATGTVWLVNAASGSKIQARTGLAGPVGVAFADDPTFGKTGLYVAEPTRILRLPDPRMAFVPRVDQRILLSKAWSFDVYPSPDQVADGQIRVRVRLSPAIDPTGKSAFFRLADPADPSPYLDDAGIADNRPVSPAGSVTGQVPFDVDGVATAVLTVDNQHSGNNYRVEASLAGGGAFRTLATSPVYTTWRRTYLEHDFMWRSGAWIVADSGAGEPNPMRVWVADSSGFTVGDDVHVLSGTSAETATGEFGLVAAVGPGYVDVDTSFGAGGAGLRYRYPASPGDSLPFSFLALVGPGVYGMGPDMGQLAIAFDDAFAEWTLLPTGGFVPSWPEVTDGPLLGNYISDRQSRFFNALRMDQRPSILNTIHFVTAASGPALGLTLSTTAFNWTWIFGETIEASFPSDSDAALMSVVAHELAHQFDVNPGSPNGHDDEAAWSPSDGLCLMNVARDRTRGVVKMHAPFGAPSQDLTCVRSHVDDLDSSALCSP